MSTPLIKRRTAILTASAMAITAVGAYTGAQLKTDSEKRAEVAKVQGMGIDVKIRRLVNHRDELVRRKVELESKIMRLEAEADDRSE